MNINSKNIILFTGAGFTKNFGGFLAKEMWSFIFNNPAIQKNKKLKKLLSSNFDYESAYNTVIENKGYTSSEKDIIKQAIEEAYKSLDDAIKDWNFNNNNPSSLNIYGLREFIVLFSGTGQEQGFCFTLNQDIFMERKNIGGNPLCMGQLDRTPIGQFTREHYKMTLSDEQIKSVQDDISAYGNMLYIKLHGSYGWLSQNGENQMIIGSKKLKHINNEPLLKFYFNIFKEVISQGNKKIVIVGYGFNDNHINNILLKGTKDNNLKLIIIGQSDPSLFKLKMQHTFGNNFEGFWDSIIGFFPYKLTEIFPHSQDLHPTVIFQYIKRSILS